ncbi:Clp protease N-terminal domain-containing protein [Chloroflexota bacterium]
MISLRSCTISNIGTEHLLLGILLEGGVAAGVLRNLGVTIGKVRAGIRK